MSHRPSLTTDTLDDQTTPKQIEPSVTVCHEDLRWVDDEQSPLHSEVFTQPKTVTNVPAEYT
jgi:hypothetical protein